MVLTGNKNGIKSMMLIIGNYVNLWYGDIGDILRIFIYKVFVDWRPQS
jgi:hypothetical protein